MRSGRYRRRVSLAFGFWMLWVGLASACAEGEYTATDPCVDAAEWLERISNEEYDEADEVAHHLASAMSKVGTSDDVYDQIRSALIAWTGYEAGMESMGEEWDQAMLRVSVQCDDYDVTVIP